MVSSRCWVGKSRRIKTLLSFEAFSALGISVSFSRFPRGEVIFTNTERRVEEVSEYIESRNWSVLEAARSSQEGVSFSGGWEGRA